MVQKAKVCKANTEKSVSHFAPILPLPLLDTISAN